MTSLKSFSGTVLVWAFAALLFAALVVFTATPAGSDGGGGGVGETDPFKIGPDGNPMYPGSTNQPPAYKKYKKKKKTTKRKYKKKQYKRKKITKRPAKKQPEGIIATASYQLRQYEVIIANPSKSQKKKRDKKVSKYKKSFEKINDIHPDDIMTKKWGEYTGKFFEYEERKSNSKYYLEKMLKKKSVNDIERLAMDTALNEIEAANEYNIQALSFTLVYLWQSSLIEEEDSLLYDIYITMMYRDVLWDAANIIKKEKKYHAAALARIKAMPASEPSGN